MTKRKPVSDPVPDQAVLDLLAPTGRAAVVAVTLRVALRTVARVLRRMEVAGKVKRTGAGRVTRWEVVR